MKCAEKEGQVFILKFELSALIFEFLYINTKGFSFLTIGPLTLPSLAGEKVRVRGNANDVMRFNAFVLCRK